MNVLGVKRSVLFSVGFTVGLAVCSGALILDAARENGKNSHVYLHSNTSLGEKNAAIDIQPEPFADYAKNASLDHVAPEIVSVIPAQEDFVTPQTKPGHFVSQASLGFHDVDPFELVAANFATALTFPDRQVQATASYVPHDPAVYDAGDPVYDGDEIAAAPIEEGIETVTGAIRFHSADTASVGDVLLRLSGVHGPTSADMCLTASGQAYDCGDWAEAGMRAVVADREVTCRIFKQTDFESGAKYAECSLTLRNGETRDLAEIGLESGILVLPEEVETDPYRISQDKARTSGYGVWSGTYEYAKKGKEEA